MYCINCIIIEGIWDRFADNIVPPGLHPRVEDRVSFQGVLDGKYDDLPEQSFYMVGGIEEVIAKAEKISKESATSWSNYSSILILTCLFYNGEI